MWRIVLDAEAGLEEGAGGQGAHAPLGAGAVGHVDGVEVRDDGADAVERVGEVEAARRVDLHRYGELAAGEAFGQSCGRRGHPHDVTSRLGARRPAYAAR